MSAKVYIVSSGCKHEGGSVDAVFSSPTLACLHAESLVAERQQRVEENNAELRADIEKNADGHYTRDGAWGDVAPYEQMKLDSWAVEIKDGRDPRCIAAWGTRHDFVVVMEWALDSVRQ